MVQATKIRIRSPTPAGEGGDGRFVVPFRGWRFYFSDPEGMVGDGYVPERGDEAMSAKKSEYLDAAVGGEQVLELKERAWVCSLLSLVAVLLYSLDVGGWRVYLLIRLVYLTIYCC